MAKYAELIDDFELEKRIRTSKIEEKKKKRRKGMEIKK